MKNLLLLTVILLFVNLLTHSQTTAVDFSLQDCKGNLQSLYKTLDSGYVVIMEYEHQCGSCTSGAKNLKAITDAYYSSETRLKMIYLDNGGYSCSSVSNWIKNNGLLNGAAISFSSDYSSPYGSGMPVIVIAAGRQHKVFMKTNSLAAADTATIHKAIDNALNELNSGVEGSVSAVGSIRIYPAPVTGEDLHLQINSKENEIITIRILDIRGNEIRESESLEIKPGNNDRTISLNGLENGLYFMEIRTAFSVTIKKVIIQR